MIEGQKEVSVTENKLKRLFDYQTFENLPSLEKIIRDTEEKFGAELDDDSLSLVAAAGDLADPAKGLAVNGNDIKIE